MDYCFEDCSISEMLFETMLHTILYMYIHQVVEKSKYFEKPNNYNNHDHNVKYFFNCGVHRNIGIDKPKKKAYDN